MKKIFLSLLMALCCLAAQAQLDAPKITVRDTFYVRSVLYNGSPLDKADWPDSVLLDDAVCLSVAGFSYMKGEPVELENRSLNSLRDGLVDIFKYKAQCNGKVVPLTIVRPSEGSRSNQVRVAMGGYEFVAVMSPADAQNTASPFANLFNGSLSGASISSRIDGALGSGNPGWSLKGRQASYVPQPPANDDHSEGRIVVKIWVDQSGRVTKAEAPQLGSTLTQTDMVDKAKAAAMEARFNADAKAAELQVGTITYVYRFNE